MSSDVSTRTEESAPASAAAKIDIGELSRRMLEETFNEGKFDLADQYVAADAIDHDPAAPPRLRDVRGPENVKQTAAMYRAAFPDVRIVIDDTIVGEDKVAVRWHSEGTHRGELEGLAPTGVHGSVTGIGINRWKDGKIVEAWAEWDNLGLARQLGAVPPEGSIGEKLGIQLQHLMARRMRKRNQLV